MKNVLKNIFRKTKKEIDSSEVDNTAQKDLLNKESLNVDMEAWHAHTNDLIKQSATVLYQMIDSEDWDVMLLHGVPTEESVDCRFYYINLEGTAYSGQLLSNPGINLDNYIEGTMHMAQCIRALYMHFKSAKMQTPSSITITVTNEGKVEVNFGYDEGISDTDSYFEAYEMNKFTHLIK
jgi:hypothetical protein